MPREFDARNFQDRRANVSTVITFKAMNKTILREFDMVLNANGHSSETSVIKGNRRTPQQVVPAEQ